MTTTLRWAPLSIEQILTLYGYRIIITTDTPCHLTLLWTTHTPWTHRRSTVERGLTIPWSSYWCYVAWSEVEQVEVGDTLEHTFWLLDWPICETRYIRFIGTIGGEITVSDSPIYIKHYAGFLKDLSYSELWSWEGVPPPDFVLCYVEPWTS